MGLAGDRLRVARLPGRSAGTEQPHTQAGRRLNNTLDEGEPAMKTPKGKRNPVARAVRTPQFRVRVVQSGKLYVRKYLRGAKAIREQRLWA